ncbi:MAG: IS21 family transposase, partial [Alkaliphilus sp.]|nr:IS21 family transposase [Alkaliphilus sp.]
KEELKKFINRPFQKIEGNRLTAFERIDKPFLQPLPATRYEYSEWKEAKAQSNYHVEYDGSFYSVHYSYVGQLCSVRATAKAVEIYLANERIAVHLRNYNIFKRYITLPEHMPDEHKAVTGWSNDQFLAWAEKIGPNTGELVRLILESDGYPIHTYRSCMGIMRLSKNTTPDIIEKTSREALDRRTYSYKYFSIILKQTMAGAEKDCPEKIIEHDNVRGSNAYIRGGIHAQ